MLGKLYTLSSANEGRLSCTECHEGDVHQNNMLNRHNNKIACQTCHIPEYAKGVSTKMSWDWSTAGRVKADGSKITEHDSLGNATYKSAKGTYKWAAHVIPEYVWFNGTGENMVYGDIIKDTTQVLKINELYGNHDDPKAQIIPVKIHRGRQIFDPINKMLIVPNIYGHDSTAYKHGLDWDLASKKGMEEAHPILLEPIVRLDIFIPDDYMGDIMGDMNKRRGKILGMKQDEMGYQNVIAEAPQAEVFNYATDLRSMTQARGYFNMKFERYSEVPMHLASKIIQEAKKEKANK